MADTTSEKARRLLITGATGGMGRACALLAARAGNGLVLADLSQGKLETLASECAHLGASAECHVLDVLEADSIGQLVTSLAQSGGIDAVIHTVGLSPQMADWKKIIDVDLVGTAAFLEAVRPHIRKGGCAVPITSMSAYLCPPDKDVDRVFGDPLGADFAEQLQQLATANTMVQDSGMAYAWSKRALKLYVEDHAADWGAEGKRLVSIAPGLIDTDMGRLENAAMENFDAMRSRVALDRLGEPEDIANTALFLASDKAAYITGCDILVDGGFVGRVAQEQRQNT